MASIKHESNTDIFRGQLFIFVGDDPIAFGTSASMSITAEEIDISNKMMAGNWKASLPGQKGFSITSESLLTRKEGQCSYDTLMDKLSNDETITFFLGQSKVTNQTATGGEFALDKTQPYYTGNVMIASLDLTSENNGIATCSASFTGVGALVKGEVTQA